MQIKNSFAACHLEQFSNVKQPKRSKYRNVKCEINGHKFDSKHEASIYTQLCCLLAAGKVQKFHCQWPFDLSVNDVKIGKYIADFLVYDDAGNMQVWDAKSPITRKNPVYRLKRKLMQAVHGIDIKEV